MTIDPHRLSCIFCCLKLLDHPLELAGQVRVRGVYEVQEVGVIPEICVEGDDPQTCTGFD